ncbi:siroheme synthase [Luminiphilus syltensis NOR5-1B]|uniref:Siroheme synthase n=1 Tax=Luminiphilus syltensis NOR5-1B TaxID=565045 RepID=B8KRK2_9GAMM|nr:siroheme synthase CysG [Luminiphilus syltensis]EED36254.1 siroheme synthase [Luminiphilus syltensis NOR5-1B]
MDYLPVCLKLDGEPVLLVGGGEIATRKARLLHRAGAVLTVVAPEVSAELTDLVGDSARVQRTPWSPEKPLDQFRAVIAATNDTAVNAEVSQVCRAANLPVNVVDSPALCSFIIPAIVDRNPLLVGISSSGASPVMARRIRSTLETLYPPGYGAAARFYGEQRDRVSSEIAEEGDRRQFWEAIVDSPITDLLARQEVAEASRRFDRALEDPGALIHGAVYLIGAGPGDPDLMTFKALRLLQRADVVLYDRLIGDGILELARRDADRIYVGKQRSEHAMPQDQINQALVDYARAGKRVARLKGGDPFIFGRGGEEIEGLMKAGIDFEVVPGITAASGAACYGGIPLTHRDHAQSVRFITGHTRNYELNLPWAQFLNPAETLVFYMGLAGLEIICRELMAAGRAGDTPMAVIEKATRPDQRVITGTLSTMHRIVEETQPAAPTLLIIGSVVTLHESLGWFNGTSSDDD